jgi:hypothetical protein
MGAFRGVKRQSQGGTRMHLREPTYTVFASAIRMAGDRRRLPMMVSYSDQNATRDRTARVNLFE